ncbi:MAG: epoxyqueuosine reductase [Chloroflexi bacterium]|nr:epoxyqueuosine reductase [Chloroflexota bacterium]
MRTETERHQFQNDPGQSVIDFIKRFVAESPLNRLDAFGNNAIFEDPLVGFASGGDPLFGEYKKIIGEHHLTPQEVMENGGRPPGRNLSVVCWALPIATDTKKGERREKTYPSRRWGHTRFYGEQFNDALRNAVAGMLEDMGYASVAPVASKFYWMSASKYAANWSERHALYAAGLGTFGLNDGFITAKGIAMRCGSVVTSLELPPTPRTFKSHMANCPYVMDGSCGRCMERCPSGSISAQGHDKTKCFNHMKTVYEKFHEDYQVQIIGCGLCQTRVPCEMAAPKGKTATAQV